MDTSVLLELYVTRKKRLATQAIDLDNELVSSVTDFADKVRDESFTCV